MVQAEGKLLGAAVVLELIDGTDIVLACQLILQFQSDYGNTIYRQHHVDGIAVGSSVAELTGAAKNICFIAFNCQWVQIGLRLKEANFQFAAHVLNTVAENVKQALVGDGSFQAMIQLICSRSSIILGILRPFFGLSLCNELAQHIHVNALCDIVLTIMYPVAVSILSVKLGISTFRGNEEGFYVPFKAFFTFIH